MTEAVHTLDEAAVILRVPYRVVRDAVFQGRWPHVRISQRRRVMTDTDIASVLDMLRQEPTPPISPLESRQMRRNIHRLLNG